MEPKFTPGPWRSKNESDAFAVTPQGGGRPWVAAGALIVGSGRVIGDVEMRTIRANEGGGYDYCDNIHEMRANMRLIAAAPDNLNSDKEV